MKLNIATWRGLTLALVLAAASQARPIGVSLLTTIVAPDPIRNAIVRIELDEGASTFAGTGTVIEVHSDGVGLGGWICVLTADHVVRETSGALGGTFRVGFGDEGGGGVEFSSASTTINVAGGPANGADRVDLGILGVRVADLTTLPTFELPSLSSVDDGDTIYLSGYGDQATLDGPNRRYDVVPTYGSILSGFNGVDAQPEFSLAAGSFTYRYDSLEASTLFGPPAPDPAIQGEAHVLSGDSGGPAWTPFTSGWGLVGVHSVSETHGAAGSETVEEGDRLWDVRVASYASWIDVTCDTVVPEPTTCVVLGAGLLAAMARRRRNRVP